MYSVKQINENEASWEWECSEKHSIWDRLQIAHTRFLSVRFFSQYTLHTQPYFYFVNSSVWRKTVSLILNMETLGKGVDYPQPYLSSRHQQD